MRTCPRCGYRDPAHVAAAERYDRKRSGTRAAYMRAYRKRKKAAGGGAKKSTNAKKGRNR